MKDVSRPYTQETRKFFAEQQNTYNVELLISRLRRSFEQNNPDVHEACLVNLESVLGQIARKGLA